MKVLIILFTQLVFYSFCRHGLNGKAAKTDGLETSRPLSSCSLSQFFPPENAEGSPYMREEIISYYQTGRTKNTRNIRRLIFHRVQYFCRGGFVQLFLLLHGESYFALNPILLLTHHTWQVQLINLTTYFAFLSLKNRMTIKQQQKLSLAMSIFTLLLFPLL